MCLNRGQQDAVCWLIVCSLFPRYLELTSANEVNGWYGGTLLGDQDESSDIYRHYAELCQVLRHYFNGPVASKFLFLTGQLL